MNLELADDDRALLKEILAGRLTELREEVHHARVSRFKDHLREKERQLVGIIDQIQDEED